jgi:4-hydroxymandelate oxidase
MVMSNLVAVGAGSAPEGSMLSRYVASRHDASLTWNDLAWLRSITSLPLVLKGIVRPDDAVRAASAGVAGIIVSNHGARQLDGAPATLDALPGVVDAVEDRCEVLMDGGVRWGTDVLKALALGARAVLIGRPILWGLAVGGQEGVERILDLFTRELARAMALAGCPSVAALGRDLVRRRG